MSRVPKATLCCLLLTAVFTFGSMAGMSAVLQVRECRRLEERGIVKMESPVLAWQTSAEKADAAEEGQETGRPGEEEARQLTAEQMEEVIRYNGLCEWDILHEPTAEQITMEEAIAAGESWLIRMGLVPAEYEETVTSHKASLGVKFDYYISERPPIKPYYSFWTVCFSNEAMYGILSVNAVTGRVWDAEVTLYGNAADDPPPEKPELFLRLAGVQEETGQCTEAGENRVIMPVKGSSLYAMYRYYDMLVADKDKIVMADDKTVIVDHGGDPRYASQQVIEYHLMAGE